MNINSIKSDLKMRDLYFPECSFLREKELKNGELSANLEKNIDKISDHVYDVTLSLEVTKEDMKVKVIAKATFVFEADDYSEEDEVINVNTVAIMFPFIRSEVTLITSQPGMQPIILPAINTTKMR